MKIYFSSTVKAKNKLDENFKVIYKTIEKLGHKNVSDFLIKVKPEKFYSRTADTAGHEYKDMVKKVKSSDVVVFEVSLSSLGIGYLVNMVLAMEKPVVLLHTKDHSPYLFKFLKNDRLQIYEYSSDNLKDVLASALDVAKESISVRFTFFVTPKILHFFDYIAKQKKIPRAVYLRRLIQDAIKKEKFKPQSPF